MDNKNATIYLNTPLINLEVDGELLQDVSRIRGKIISEEKTGIIIQIKDVGNDKKWFESSMLKKIFVPAHKIDFINFE